MDDLTAERAHYTQAILESDAPKRLIVAGPGTGKTYTFQRALEDIEGEAIALTFINNLADELSDDLQGLAEARTFHSFCKALLHQHPSGGLTAGFEYLPTLFELLAKDLNILDVGENVGSDDIDRIFQDLHEDHPILHQVVDLGAFYNAVSHADVVYRAFKAIQRDSNLIPSYDLIVVDEYQDFTKLETEFIDLLAEENRVLIAGDDDQALYGFRHASPDFIRDAFLSEDYADFELPYCSRCPQVVVNSFRDLVDSAQRNGLLAGRIDKDFRCFLPDLREVSQRNPSLIHARCSVERKNAPYMGRYITTRINRIPRRVVRESHEGGYPTVLVVGSEPFLGSVHDVLSDQFNGVLLKKGGEGGADPIRAYSMLIDDNQCRLAWRMLVDFHSYEGARDHVRESLDERVNLYRYLPEDYREYHLRVARLFDASFDRQLSTNERELVEAAIGQNLEDLLRDDQDNDTAYPLTEDEPEIVCTSMSGSKGMSAAYVFIVGMVDEYFPQDPNDPSSAEIRKLLVALTRTRVRCHLVSCERPFGADYYDESTFISWINPNRIELQSINKERLSEIEPG